MSFPKPLLLALLIAACTLPDEIGIGANGGQYDYFASSEQDLNSWPFSNETGQSYGLNVWASWRLKPVEMVYVNPNRYANPFDRGETPTITINNKENETSGEEGVKPEDIADVTKDMRNEELIFWGVALSLVALCLILVGPRILEFLKHKKQHKV